MSFRSSSRGNSSSPEQVAAAAVVIYMHYSTSSTSVIKFNNAVFSNAVKCCISYFHHDIFFAHAGVHISNLPKAELSRATCIYCRGGRPSSFHPSSINSIFSETTAWIQASIFPLYGGEISKRLSLLLPVFIPFQTNFIIKIW